MILSHAPTSSVYTGKFSDRRTAAAAANSDCRRVQGVPFQCGGDSAESKYLGGFTLHAIERYRVFFKAFMAV